MAMTWFGLSGGLLALDRDLTIVDNSFRDGVKVDDSMFVVEVAIPKLALLPMTHLCPLLHCQEC